MRSTDFTAASKARSETSPCARKAVSGRKEVQRREVPFASVELEAVYADGIHEEAETSLKPLCRCTV